MALGGLGLVGGGGGVKIRLHTAKLTKRDLKVGGRVRWWVGRFLPIITHNSCGVCVGLLQYVTQVQHVSGDNKEHIG